MAAERARAVAAAIQAAEPLGVRPLDVLAPSALARHRHDRAYLIDGRGSVIVAFPASEHTVPTPVHKLMAALCEHSAGLPRYEGGRDGAPALADYVVLDDRLAVAAVATAAGHLSASGAQPTRPMLALIAFFDRGLAEVLREKSGLADLAIDSTRAAPDAEAQGILDRDGRIAGWITWTTQRPAFDAVVSFAPFLLLFMLCLVGAAVFLARGTRRARKEISVMVERAQAAAALDPLTGLPNRRMIMEYVDAVLAERPTARVVTFAHVDLDHLADVNDALGHEGGDELLTLVGARLTAAAGERALAGRLGGDEFALVLITEDIEAAIRAVDTAREALARPFWVKGQVVGIGARFGLAHAPRDGLTRLELMRRADFALRAAKRMQRGSIVVFEPTMETELEDRRFIKTELRRALGEGTLDLHYQPIVAADGSRIVGVEALLRWTHKMRGDISPAVFVPVAEQTGLMHALGEFILRKALTDAMRWPNLYMTVNISPVQMRDPAFVDLVASVIKEVGIAPSRVVLEVTEGVLIDDPHEAERRLDQLRALGVQIALDDFGVGYSSLNYLHQFPFDKLKIDKEFVARLGRTANGAAIVQSIIGLGRALGLGVLAEGVETEEQRSLLRLAGCDELQGYLFAKPSPCEHIDEMVAIAEARGAVERAPRVVQAAVG
jgi:diguanylate cyclase (GGDEF)-like protein